VTGIDTFPDFVKQLTEAELPFPGAKAWLVQGDGQQIAFIEFSDSADVPEHSHEEQWEFVITGSVRLRLDGTEYEHGPGDNFFIPAGSPHSARVSAGYRAMIVFNAPDRYRSKDAS
jgi:quercetin dioxygenase-like cupin family protein